MLTNRHYGVEIEALAASLVVIDAICADLNANGVPCVKRTYCHQTLGTWKITHDSSVKQSGKAGFELVSPKLQGENGLAQISMVCFVLSQHNVTVNKTCGLHVHHDASDYKAKHFTRLFKLYQRSEKALDGVVAHSRRNSNNRYCKSLKGLEESVTRTDRYYKLNLKAFHRHGTVEVRHHQGTVEAVKIQNWVILTQGLVERAKREVNTEGHDLTLYDVLQAAGVIHSRDTRACAVREYFTSRKAHFMGSAV